MFAIVILCAALQTRPVSLGPETLQVEIADTPETRAKGLMDRQKLPPNTGMLFVFDTPQRLSFWMKDTLIPLSIAFFDENRKLIEMLDMEVLSDPKNSVPSYWSSKPALYALEVPKDWFRQKGINPGEEFSFLDHPDRIK